MFDYYSVHKTICMYVGSPYMLYGRVGIVRQVLGNGKLSLNERFNLRFNIASAAALKETLIFF